MGIEGGFSLFAIMGGNPESRDLVPSFWVIGGEKKV
jgi:hypothetical protein